MDTIKTTGKPFGIVSDALLEDQKLAPTTRLVGGWIEGRPDGWEIRSWYLCLQLGISKDAWQKARRELIREGYLTSTPAIVRGQFQGYSYFFDIPKIKIDQHKDKRNRRPEVEKTGAGKTSSGNSGAGKTGTGKSNRITRGVESTGVGTLKPPPPVPVVVGKEISREKEKDQQPLTEERPLVIPSFLNQECVFR